MNFHYLLCQCVAAERPVCVGLIGAGKLGSMSGAEIAAIADLDLERARIGQ